MSTSARRELPMNTTSTHKWPFQKVLIANRGEIAVRIIRACRELGLTSVAVFSDVDRNALQVRIADEAYHIGPSQASKSYLHIPTIIETAKRPGAQAIHPGYGFLSENAFFVEACSDERLIFVGPMATVQRAVGEKTAARSAAQVAGVPIVPGAMTDMVDEEGIQQIAKRIGYPLLLKAAAGGGGKGIRFVRDPKDLTSALLVILRCSSSQIDTETWYTWVNASAAYSAVTRSWWRNALPLPWMKNYGIVLRLRRLT